MQELFFSTFIEDASKMTERTATIQRHTLETQIEVKINFDGTGKSHFETGVPFL